MGKTNAPNALIREELTELHEGLQILELEERFEMVQLAAVATTTTPVKQSTRCDVTTA